MENKNIWSKILHIVITVLTAIATTFGVTSCIGRYKNSVQPLQLHAILIFIKLITNYLTSSKSTIIHYQCVSTRCCVHVARIKISIDNQHVTKTMQRYDNLPEQPKEKA